MSDWEKLVRLETAKSESKHYLIFGSILGGLMIITAIMFAFIDWWYLIFLPIALMTSICFGQLYLGTAKELKFFRKRLKEKQKAEEEAYWAKRLREYKNILSNDDFLVIDQPVIDTVANLRYEARKQLGECKLIYLKVDDDGLGVTAKFKDKSGKVLVGKQVIPIERYKK